MKVLVNNMGDTRKHFFKSLEIGEVFQHFHDFSFPFSFQISFVMFVVPINFRLTDLTWARRQIRGRFRAWRPPSQILLGPAGRRFQLSDRASAQSRQHCSHWTKESKFSWILKIVVLMTRKDDGLYPIFGIVTTWDYLRYFVLSGGKAMKFVFSVRNVNLVDQMMSMMEKYADNLEELVEDRTQQLAEEQRKTEELLARMVPRYGHPVKYEQNCHNFLFWICLVMYWWVFINVFMKVRGRGVEERRDGCAGELRHGNGFLQRHSRFHRLIRGQHADAGQYTNI